MFCTKCGAENQPEAHFCHNCGADMTGMQATQVEDAKPQALAEIWNPNAAVNWSILFSPAFGTYLQMLNWKALGEPEKAKKSEGWFYVSLVFLGLYILMGLMVDDPDAAERSARGLGFLYLIFWYFANGRAQGKYVKERFGKDYPRKPWGKALLIGVGAFIAYFMFAVLAGLTVGVVQAI